jgi:L-lactate dehydrogenase (cytochrome)
MKIEHPGGEEIILKYAVCTIPSRPKSHLVPQWAHLLTQELSQLQGKDATEEFEPIHPRDTLDKYLEKSKHLGPVDMSTVAQEAKKEDPEEAERQQRIAEMPSLSQCFNLHDFEAIARRTMKKSAWGYYSSAADDEIVSIILRSPNKAATLA